MPNLIYYITIYYNSGVHSIMKASPQSIIHWPLDRINDSFLIRKKNVIRKYIDAKTCHDSGVILVQQNIEKSK